MPQICGNPQEVQPRLGYNNLTLQNCNVLQHRDSYIRPYVVTRQDLS